MTDRTPDRDILEIEALPFWTGPIQAWPLAGGITNRNYGVQQADGQRFAVRLGEDKPEHGVMRFNEQAAARAAAKARLSPRIFYTAPGVMIGRLLPGHTLSPSEVRAPENLPRIAALIRGCHTLMAPHLQGPLLAFWVFHINRSYAQALEESRLAPRLPALMDINTQLERRAGKVQVAFCHNDLLAANILDDGVRLWLLDWDYAGFNAPMFDLANLSSNNGFNAEEDEALLHAYSGEAPQPEDFALLQLFKCASLLREALWSAVSELNPQADFDYRAYTEDYLNRLDAAWARFG